MSHYSPDFYAKRHQLTQVSARKILSRTLRLLPPINSALDIGCGVGSWLSVLKEQGVHDVAGTDGAWVPMNYLVIPKDCFYPRNLSEKLDLGRQFELVISLEVAEHIPESEVEVFIRNMTRHGKYILFSAAIPFQGGSNHINEQWPSYWANLFLREGFRCIDLVRQAIWHEEDIPYYYRQNICLYVREDCVTELLVSPQQLEQLLPLPMDVVHPERFLRTEIASRSVKGAWKFLRRAIKRALLKG